MSIKTPAAWGRSGLNENRNDKMRGGLGSVIVETSLSADRRSSAVGQIDVGHHASVKRHQLQRPAGVHFQHVARAVVQPAFTDP